MEDEQSESDEDVENDEAEEEDDNEEVENDKAEQKGRSYSIIEVNLWLHLCFHFDFLDKLRQTIFHSTFVNFFVCCCIYCQH